jgi:L-ascorbate metabolism protein UlaG (beta-lactamase superfamily)
LRSESSDKADENYSYVLKHPGGTILIVPSANYHLKLFEDVQAEIVFLSIGTLGKRTDEFVRGYWREAVQRTGAKVVIPIHWDDFSRPLDEPLRALPYFIDDMERSMRRLQVLAEEDGRQIRFMPLFEPVAYSTILAEANL